MSLLNLLRRSFRTLPPRWYDLAGTSRYPFRLQWVSNAATSLVDLNQSIDVPEHVLPNAPTSIILKNEGPGVIYYALSDYHSMDEPLALGPDDETPGVEPGWPLLVGETERIDTDGVTRLWAVASVVDTKLWIRRAAP